MKTHSDCVLHWGLSRRLTGAWQRPPEAFWPAGTVAVDAHAVHTPLASNEKGERQVAIQLELPCPWKNLPFVLYFPREKRWLKPGTQDFCIPLPRGLNGVAKRKIQCMQKRRPRKLPLPPTHTARCCQSRDNVPARAARVRARFG